MTFVRFVYLLALVIWLGEIVFFSFVVAPALFGVLGAERAAPVLATIFPRYYAIGAVAAALALGAAMILQRHGRGWWLAAVVAVAVGLVATAWAGAVVHPRAQRLRLAAEAAARAPAEDPAFQDAHRTAVVLNVVALLAGLAALGASVAE